MQKALALVLLFSLVGLILLLFIANYSLPKEVPIILLQEHIDSKVKISGEITYASHSNETSFFKVKDNTGEIRVVAFDRVDEIKKYDLVSVKGKVEVYEGKLEVIAHQISLL